MFGIFNRIKVTPTIQAALGEKFSSEELRIIDSIGTEVRIPAGTGLMVEGNQGREAFLILEGSAAVSRRDEVIAHVGPGDLVGEGALLTGDRRNASIIATTPITALVFSRQDFRYLLLESERMHAEAHALAAERS